MSHKFPNIGDVPDGLDEGVSNILLEIKEILELSLSRRKTTYVPLEGYELANKRYVDSTGLINRDNINDWDFTESDLTTDGNWHDLDLREIVPEGAYAVMLDLRVKDDAIDSELLFRKDDDANSFSQKGVRTQVVNQYNEATRIIFCNSDRIIQYMGSNVTFTEIDVMVAGWYVGNST